MKCQLQTQSSNVLQDDPYLSIRKVNIYLFIQRPLMNMTFVPVTVPGAENTMRDKMFQIPNFRFQ